MVERNLLSLISPSQTSMNVVVSNVTLVENGLGIMSLIYGPPSLLHLFADKRAQIQVCFDSLTCYFST